MMWCDAGRGAPYISLQPRRKMERSLRVAIGLDGERSEGLKRERMYRMCGELDATHIFLIYGADIIKTVAGRR
jgi:hypothetical protein